MKSRKGFTLIELMIVVVIVAILAAVIVPMLLSRVERAKTSEGKAIAAQIATAIRTYVAENDPAAGAITISDLATLGFKSAELDGKYYLTTGSGVSDAELNANGTLNYTILVKSRDATKAPDVTLTCTNNISKFNDEP